MAEFTPDDDGGPPVSNFVLGCWIVSAIVACWNAYWAWALWFDG